jgi:hypothetical protein
MEKLDPDQLQFVEILARLMHEHELFREDYMPEDYARVTTWLRKLRTQIDITLEMLEDRRPEG